MTLRINDIAPDFTAESTAGPIRFHEWIGDSYAVLFSHPKDFTPVCTTEFAAVAGLAEEFARRGAKVIGVSIDPLDSHRKWKDDIEAYGGAKVDFPLIADPDLTVAKLYDMLPADTVLPDGRTPAHTATVRSTFFIGPDKKVRAVIVYPMTVGRNFEEILRVLDALRLTDGVPLATPADWRQGEDVIVALALDNEQARAKYGDLDIRLPYIRKARQPA